MSTQKSFKQARTDFLSLVDSDIIFSKDLLQYSLDHVTLTFNQANGADQKDSAREMIAITIAAKEIGLRKPKLLAKTPA